VCGGGAGQTNACLNSRWWHSRKGEAELLGLVHLRLRVVDALARDLKHRLRVHLRGPRFFGDSGQDGDGEVGGQSQRPQAAAGVSMLKLAAEYAEVC